MDDIKQMKNKCHQVFDSYWAKQLKGTDKKHIRNVRKRAYIRLTTEMRLPDKRYSHFSKMNDLQTLNKAYAIIIQW